MHTCVKCGEVWSTEWLARYCETCNPFECDRCGECYPSRDAAHLCCRD